MVGLLSHQILLQIIGSVLLQGVPRVVPSLANILLQSPAPTSSVTTCTLQSLSHSAMPINDNKGLPHTDLLPGNFSTTTVIFNGYLSD